MIIKENCRHLGTLAKPHGTRGSLLLRLKDIKAEEFKKRESVFVEIDGLLVPFFIESSKDSSADSIILTFEDISSETLAKTLTGTRVYVNPDQVSRRKKSKNDTPDIHGYRVIDRNLGFIGFAGDIEDIANNPLLHVTLEKKEFLIPVHEDIILQIDDKNREIHINAPDGLLEL